jgi:molecular chaperone GrpE
MSEQPNSEKLPDDEANLNNEEVLKEEKSAECELKECQNKYLRLLADQENTRRRLYKEKQDTVKFAIENTVTEFFPILDNFENALNFAQNSSKEVQQWASGFQMILSQFRDVLHNHGIVAFHSTGNIFDPHYHEAMEIVETHDHPDGTILDEFAKGYKSGNRTIRPARVKVAKTPQEELTEETKKDAEKADKNNLEKEEK